MDEKKKKKMIDDEALDQVTGGIDINIDRDLSADERRIIMQGLCPYCNERLQRDNGDDTCVSCNIKFKYYPIVGNF